MIRKIIICPECKSDLDETLDCMVCGRRYEYKNGVYNVLPRGFLKEYEFSEWKIDESDLEKTAAEYKEFRQEYISRLNQETLEAQKAQSAWVKNEISKMRGTVLDIATGRGRFLDEILSCDNKEIRIICSDIDARILAVTKKIKQTGEDVSYIGMDGRHMALKDESVEHVVSFEGLANMPDTEQAICEIYRVLKRGGSFLYKATFVDRDSKSYSLAEECGVGRAVHLEQLISILKASGFAQVEGTIVAEAVWAENPYDVIPATGDSVGYGVVIAKKSGNGR